MFDVPLSEHELEMQNHICYPSAIHTRDTEAFKYFRHQLMEMIIAQFKFTFPQEWIDIDIEDYWNRLLFYGGSVCITLIPSYDNSLAYPCMWQWNSDKVNRITGRPLNIYIKNPWLNDNKKRTINKDAVIIRLRADYTPISDIVDRYANELCLCETAILSNLNMCKDARIFKANTPQQAETIKKAMDKVLGGEPIVISGESVIDAVQDFNPNLGQNFIANDIQTAERTIISRFCTEVGIPNVNYEKTERLVTDEVNQNNTETETHIDYWMSQLEDSINRANNMFGLSLKVERVFKNNLEEGGADCGKNNYTDNAEL